MASKRTQRTEVEIFSDLTALTAQPGYVHALATICFRDNVISLGGTLKTEDIAKQYSDGRLLRTEISTLLGLMIKVPFNGTIPDQESIQGMVDQTDRLMQELHESINAPMYEYFRQALTEGESDNLFTRGALLREAIFYGGESAYLFHYRDLAIPKYSSDDGWLMDTMGFTIEEAHSVVSSILNVQNERLTASLNRALTSQTYLPCFTFNLDEITKTCGLSSDRVLRVVAALSLPDHERNSGFTSIADFNAVNAFPLIHVAGSEYLSLQSYSLVAALYESPFYWMAADKSYRNSAAEHRGQFTEQYCAERLRDVFGSARVMTNVSIYMGKNRATEIDVLVLFADRAIIVQAKSKRLTIEARKGNDNRLREDFQKSIQDAYDQGAASARLLLDSSAQLRLNDGTTIKPGTPITEIYIFCVLSEHYPALAFQSRQFLKINADNVIKPPFVMDVFTLDTISEMLNTPLYFLSYINRRVGYADKIMSSHELTILSYHLTQNLWIDQKYDMVQLSDDISTELDMAMMVRRDGLPGAHTPDGILTRFRNSQVGRLISQIEHTEDTSSIDLGFLLLSLSEDTVLDLGNGIAAICERSRADRKHHDVTIAVESADTGICVHANFDPDERARQRLEWHCLKRKYAQRAGTWYGICLAPSNKHIRFGLALKFPWTHSVEMDQIVSDLPKGGKTLNLKTYTRSRRRKVGRNDLCPCGSGKKYKKCCLRGNAP